MHTLPKRCLALAVALTVAPAAGCGFRKTQQASEACFVYVVTSDSHSCARKSDGTLFCWGNNQYGQLGFDTGGAPVVRPTQVETLGPGIDAVYVPTSLGALSSRTATTCARKTDGTISCWGNNQNGQLGVGDSSEHDGPVAVAPEILGIGRHHVTGGAGFFCSRRADRSLYCWGNNEFGQLGDGTTMQRFLPTHVEGLAMNALNASAGGNHVCALKDDGSLWCWGKNSLGQLGLGDTTHRSTPVAVTALGNEVASVFAGADHTCAVKTDQTLWCWGSNAQGQLGLGDSLRRTTPSQVDFPDLGTGVSVVSAGAAHTCAVKNDGSLHCWGDNRFGQLGNRTKEKSLAPTPVVGEYMSAGVQVVYAGGAHTCALGTDSALWCWGQNQFSQLGRVTDGDALEPYQIAPPCR